MLAALWVTAIATAVLTVGGLITAVIALRTYGEQLKANQKQAQLIDLQLRAQARRVLVRQKSETVRTYRFHTKPAEQDSGDSSARVFTVHVLNTSAMPISDVVFYWYDGQNRMADDVPDRTGPLLPDSETQAVRSYDIHSPQHDYKALVSFRDPDGLTWVAKSDESQFQPVSPSQIPPVIWPGDLSELTADAPQPPPETAPNSR